MKKKINEEVKEHEKFLKQCEQNKDAPFYQEYLRKKAGNLYQYSLMMTHFWSNLHKLSHSLNGKLIYEPDEKFNADFYKPEKKYLLVEHTANHNFINTVKEMFEQQKRGLAKKHKLYFPNDPQKEIAIFFLLTNINGNREEINKQEKNSFSWCAFESRLLSIIYANFNLFQKKLKWPAWEFLLDLDNLRDEVIADCHELIGYWHIKDARIKGSSIGGSAAKDLKGIYLAIKQVLKELKDRPKISAKFLWEHFRKKHYSKENALDIGDYSIFYVDEHINHEDEYGKIKPIKFRTFSTYVRKTKKTAK